MKPFFLWLLLSLALTGCAPSRPTEIPPATSMFPTATLLPQAKRAEIVLGLDMGSGGAGFSATLYAQEVSSGETFHTFLSAGMHGASTLPTSAPVLLYVRAPGTYVFFARLTNAPDEYHYGATLCREKVCVLRALEVHPGQTYHVTIDDSSALLPEINQAVQLPWEVQP